MAIKIKLENLRLCHPPIHSSRRDIIRKPNIHLLLRNDHLRGAWWHVPAVASVDLFQFAIDLPVQNSRALDLVDEKEAICRSILVG